MGSLQPIVKLNVHKCILMFSSVCFLHFLKQHFLIVHKDIPAKTVSSKSVVSVQSHKCKFCVQSQQFDIPLPRFTNIHCLLYIRCPFNDDECKKCSWKKCAAVQYRKVDFPFNSSHSDLLLSMCTILCASSPKIRWSRPTSFWWKKNCNWFNIMNSPEEMKRCCSFSINILLIELACCLSFIICWSIKTSKKAFEGTCLYVWLTFFLLGSSRHGIGHLEA